MKFRFSTFIDKDEIAVLGLGCFKGELNFYRTALHHKFYRSSRRVKMEDEGDFIILREFFKGEVEQEIEEIQSSGRDLGNWWII